MLLNGITLVSRRSIRVILSCIPVNKHPNEGFVRRCRILAKYENLLIEIQGAVSSCRKLMVQPATEAENGPQVVRDSPYVTPSVTFCPRLEVTSLGLIIRSAPNSPKMQSDMIYKLIYEGSPFEALRLYTVDACVIRLGSQLALVNKSQLPIMSLTFVTLKSVQVFLANYAAIRVTLVLHTGTKHAHKVVSMLYFFVRVSLK